MEVYGDTELFYNNVGLPLFQQAVIFCLLEGLLASLMVRSFYLINIGFKSKLACCSYKIVIVIVSNRRFD